MWKLLSCLVLLIHQGLSKDEISHRQDGDLAARLDLMAEELGQLQAANQRLMSDNIQLQSDKNKLKSDMDQLRGSDAARDATNRHLMEEITRLKAGYAELKAVQEEHDTARHDQMSRPDNITDTIAFSAYVSHSDAIYEEDSRIIFGGVEYASGSFDNNTSQFTCPTDGLYYFNINIYFNMFGPPHTGGAKLVRLGVDGVEDLMTVDTYSGSGDDDHRDVTSNTVITTCSAGDVVYTQATRTSQIFGTEADRRTTFNGLLLAV